MLSGAKVFRESVGESVDLCLKSAQIARVENYTRVEFYGVGFAGSYGIFQNRPRRNPVCVMKKEERPSEKDGYRRRCRRLNREKGLNEFR